MASSTIREFLVALGFKVDDAGQAKFEAGITRATKLAEILGETVVATAFAVGAAIDRVVDRFSELSFASQQIGASAKNISAFTFAATQMGVSTDRAQGALANFAQRLRTQPGFKGWLAGMGIDPNGDTVQVLDRLLDRLGKLGKPGSVGYALAASIADRAGLDEETMNLLTADPAYRHAEEQKFLSSQQGAGVDFDRMSAGARKLFKDIGDLKMQFGLLGDAVAQDFLKPIDDAVLAVRQFAAWLNTLDHRVKDVVAGLAAIGSAASALLAAKGIVSILKWIAGAGKKVGGPEELTGGAAGTAEAAASEAGAGAAAAAGVGWLARLSGIGTFLATLLHSTPANAGEDEMARQAARGGSGTGTLGFRSNNPGNIQLNGRELNFDSPAAGMQAMAKLLTKYGQRWGWNSISQIVSHWAPSTENDTGAYIADVAKRTGFGANDKLNLTDPTTLQKVMDAMIRHEQGGNPWGPDMERAAIRAQLGGGASITQNTTITVNGATDAHATADAVANVQRSVNSDLVRYAGVIR